MSGSVAGCCVGRDRHLDNPAAIWEAIRGPVSARLSERGRGAGSVRVLGAPPSVQDATTKLLVLDARAEPAAVVVVSSPKAPNLVARGVRNADAVRRMVGPEFGSVVIETYAEGDVEGRTYVVLPYGWSLESSYLSWRRQRAWLVPRVLTWLHRVASATQSGPSRVIEYNKELAACEANQYLDDGMRRDAATAIRRLERGEWLPRHCIDHNDMWKDNILLRSPAERQGEFPFLVIDWAGANPLGFGFFDLVRFCRSMRMTERRRRSEVGRHCAAMGCHPRDAVGHLLASLGWLGSHLEHFPPERYSASAARCWQDLRRAVEGLDRGRGEGAAT